MWFSTKEGIFSLQDYFSRISPFVTREGVHGIRVTYSGEWGVAVREIVFQSCEERDMAFQALKSRLVPSVIDLERYGGHCNDTTR